MKVIEVQSKNGEKFEITVDEQNSGTAHTVVLNDGYRQTLTEGKITKEDCIKNYFNFLFQGESKESILSSFSVRVISKYFPEFEQQIKTS
ncbi:MAG: hypothetical protein DRP62_05005 [Planctomycetota bacterium]|nr:MAG: hypothetical protein DRP62_05005 [Planctomycetota bacterium]